MKRRILALALTGTTAFSVFGTTLSANAASSTDTYYDVDAYMSYEPVATKIDVTATVDKATTTYFLKGSDGSLTTIGDATALQEHLDAQKNIKENYTEYNYIGTNSSNSNKFYADAKNENVLIVGSDGSIKNQGAASSLMTNLANIGITASQEASGKYLYNGTLYDTLAEAIAAAKEAVEGDSAYLFSDNSTVQVGGTFEYATQADYQKAKIQSVTGSVSEGEDSITVSYTGGESDPDEWTDWTFNSDLTGETDVEPYDVSTKIVDGDLVVTKEENPTIYAYDFLPYNNSGSSASSIASNWNDGDLAGTAASLVPYNYSSTETHTMVAETGRGRDGIGIRYDVVSEWEDFLYELAIDENGYTESWEEFCSNYTDMFYEDPYYDIYTGQQIGTVDVDLYNIEGLLKDIWDLRTTDAYYAANTSELVYLMQQYDKYIGDYFDKTEVDTGEWGELLLSILNSVNEDDFKRSSDYKKYINQVEELEDAYEEATTVAQLSNAEEGMYDLLTSVPYTASSTADKDELNATLEGLYFNVGSAPDTYTTAPSNQSSNVDFSNYNYYVAVAEKSGNSYSFTTILAKGYYSLYPMIDYTDYDTSTPNQVYSGNESADDFAGGYATQEYEWFWNVYQLAVRMNDDNKYQGAVDAVNEALMEAVSDLAVTTTPTSTDTAAMEEMMEEYDGKIDTDYSEDYYAKYVEAYDYAENTAEGKWQTKIANYIVGVSGEALTYQGTQNTITKNMISELEDSIKAGETALEAIEDSDSYNAAQVNALNTAIAQAEDIIEIYEGTYSTSSTYQSVNKTYSRLVGDKDQIVISDLENAMTAIDDAINYSEIIMGWSQNENGQWLYGTEDGYYNDGWHKIGATWFYFNDDGTAKQSEWMLEDGTWYYFNSNCGAACGWAKIDGDWYYFKGNNAMKTGWEKVDGNWYYMASSGKMVTGWCEIGGKWYYFSKESNALGQMLYSTTVDGYTLDENGAWTGE